MMKQVLKTQMVRRPVGVEQARVSSFAAALKKSGNLRTVAEVVGEDAVPIVQYLKGKKNISEFKIAESIKAEVNSVRKMLYAMQTSNLVSYYRKKDRQKGWYISYWTLNDPGFGELSVATRKHKLQQLRERLHKEESNHGQFYICPGLCVRVEFDRAVDISFRCPECGSALQHQDNLKTIEQLKSRIVEIEKAK